MKLLQYALSIALYIGFAAVSISQSKYPDEPAYLPDEGVQVLRTYEAKARESLPVFDERLAKKQGSEFYVVTRIYKGDFFEQIFVKVEDEKNDVYRGKIANVPMGQVSFNAGDSISVDREDVIDWVILDEDGEETGNLLGKAIDALRAGAVGFIIEMVPKGGRFVDFEIVSVLNPTTQQDVIEIVPEGVKQKILQEAQARYGGRETDSQVPRYNFIGTTFPDWAVVEELVAE